MFVVRCPPVSRRSGPCGAVGTSDGAGVVHLLACRLPGSPNDLAEVLDLVPIVLGSSLDVLGLDDAAFCSSDVALAALSAFAQPDAAVPLRCGLR